jgi:hypothetical protein
MSDEIPERAAWLDHEVQYITVPSLFEMDRLGLKIDDVILIEKQVDLHLDKSLSTAVIVVKNIEVVAIDEAAREMSYRVSGITKYQQQWEVGGAHLTPSGKRLQLM